MLDLPLLLGPMKTVIGAASMVVSAWSLKFFSDTRVIMMALYLNFVISDYQRVVLAAD
jgi:hypothetical protein